MSHPLSDKEVIEKVKQGDIDAFSAILERYQNYVLSIVTKHVPREQVEEVAHEVFIHAFRSLATFRGESEFRHWLGRVAVRRCYDFWRKRRKSREVSISSLSEEHNNWVENAISSDAKRRFDEETSSKQAKEILSWALSKLSAEERMVITLVHLEGYSVSETAQMLGWTKANVKVKAHRSRKKLRAAISQLLQTEGVFDEKK